jgi:uncharacterized OsmC-like protein
MDMPRTVTIRVAAGSPNATRTDVTAGRHTMTMDEPPARHGGDEGLLPLQALMGSLCGCTNVVANWIAADLGITLSGMTFEVAATLDTDGITGKARRDPPFPEIDFGVEVTATGTDGQIEQLKEQLAWRCPVSATFRLAGTKINERWTVHRA